MDLGEEMEDVDADAEDLEGVELFPDQIPASPPLHLFSPEGPAIALLSAIMDTTAAPSLPSLTFYGKKITADKLSDLSINEVYDHWMDRFKGDELNEEETLQMLREYWVKVVPHVYKLEANQDCLAPFRDSEELVEKYLLEPLVWFLTESETSSELLTDYLAVRDNPPTVCGRVFQVGEATYSCRQCGMDPTCVLCADCFKDSEHKSHKYKIATSAGGGYCDCGDPEAWRSFVHCRSHIPNPRKFKTEQSEEHAAFDKRAGLILPAILLYTFELTANELDRQLPKSLAEIEDREAGDEGKGGSHLFSTVLYNDETHTFDLVIQTLTRALQCSKKDAIEFATTIDREGRSIVKVGGFQPCHDAQKIIERSTAGRGPNTKSLKCSVVKREVVQHQAFALRLLSWVEVLCTHSVSIRKIVQNVFYCKGDGLLGSEISTRSTWLVEAVLLNDTKLWKAARSCWHRLIIAGLLKEYDSKKTFAEVFTREYASIMDDFIRDDHDHSYSVTSLSVQIFTVPSIAHFLVENQDVIYTILRVLLAQCDSRVNAAGKLEFDRGAVVATTSFKRTNFAILDLKYILTNPPITWANSMVKNFTNGIDSFLKFLSYMQEMDSVTRQVGQHMEYEPEWESAFNLHIKLQPVVQLSLEWCGMSRPVFIRAFRHCLHDLSKAYEILKSKTVTLELANHSATCYVYDVATQPVSVHLPLTRYFSGLYLHLQKFELDFFAGEFTLSEKPVPEMIMEPALRTQVLIAQVNASMWKRNGYALLNQLYFYHNVRCRADMLDKDIITLQIAASVVESNEFLLHVINRFGLYQWILSGFDEKALKPEGQEEDFSKYLGTLTEEFLGLLITLVSARFTPGVGQVERANTIKKEVIQQLCIEPMTHSMLNKSLVENVNLETGLELVISEVANQKGPTPQRSSVVYELKPEFYQDYDVYHYHYTREEMSKAEESQRGRKKAAKEPEIFPPPKLPPFTPMFDMLVNFLQCDVFLHLAGLVLNKSLQKCHRNIAESLVRKALHLIGHGLNEEIARNKRESGHFFQFAHNAARWKIFELLDKMLGDPLLSHHHKMILWLRSQHSTIKPDMVETQAPVAAQPDEEAEKKRKSELIKEAKEKMMAKMAAAQKKFMMVNKDLFSEETAVELGPENSNCDAEMTSVNTIGVGPCKNSPSHLPEEKFICILCQEEQSLAIENKRFVLACFIQRSTMMSQYREKLIEEASGEYQSSQGPRDLPAVETQNPIYLNPNLNSASVMTTCGHIMHDHCWSSHMETVVNKERRRPYRLRHPLSFDVDKLEWLCPMCDSICNAALPMAVHLSKMYNFSSTSSSPLSPPQLESESPAVVVVGGGEDTTKYESDPSASFDVWMQGMQLVVQNKTVGKRMNSTNEFLAWAVHRWVSPGDEHVLYNMVSWTEPKILETMMETDAAQHFLQHFPTRRYVDGEVTPHKWLYSGFHPSFTTFMTRNYHAALNIEVPKEDDFRMLLAMWNCLAFTIISSETFHRDQNLAFFGEGVPLRRNIGLKYLTRACAVTCDRQGFWIENSRSFAIKILTTLLSNRQQDPTLFECDAFGLLVSLTFSTPSLFVYTEAAAAAAGTAGGGGATPTTAQGEDASTPAAAATTGEESSSDLGCQPPCGSRLDHHILRLTYMYHVTQILLSNDFSHCLKEPGEFGGAELDSPRVPPYPSLVKEEESMDTDGATATPDDEATTNSATTTTTTTTDPDPGSSSSSSSSSRFVSRKEYIFGRIWQKAKKDDVPWDEMSKVDCNLVWMTVQQAAIPFLRCCAKFYESLTGISPPPELETAITSFDSLIKYLDLPKEFEALFASLIDWQLPYKWASHPQTAKVLETVLPANAEKYPIDLGGSIYHFLPKTLVVKYPRPLPTLAPLPDDYTELINRVSNFTCKNSKTLDSRTPTMCLVCGTILCSQSYCCQREIKPNFVIGSCMYHSNYCGGGSGIFLRIRECKLFLTHGQNRGCFLPPPYLDEYGEPDQGLRRGNPLRLSTEKYEALRKLWVQHAIPEEIARTTEHSVTAAATEWQYL